MNENSLIPYAMLKTAYTYFSFSNKHRSTVFENTKSHWFIHAGVEDELNLQKLNFILLDKVESEPTLESNCIELQHLNIFFIVRKRYAF
jgi:hypothetical protein